MTRAVSPSIDVVLFDAVGTLFWPDPPVATAYRLAGAQFGCPLTEDTVRARFREAFCREFAQRTGPITEATERERWSAVVAAVFPEATDSRALFEHLWQHFADPAHWRLAASAKECLQAVLARGFTPGIASNFDGRLRGICGAHDLPIAERRVFISSELGFAKPQPAFYRRVAERLQCGPEAILLVGDDRVNDYEAPRAAGWQARLLREEEELPAALRDLLAEPASQRQP
jgi:putative hydrolase of the HAD superfamily